MKVHGRWGQATKQTAIEGSRRVLILSLLCDHCLILHPEQQTRATAKKPLYTFGSLQQHLKMTAFMAWLAEWLEGEGLVDQLQRLKEVILVLVPLQNSDKHMNGRDLGKLEATPALKYRAQEVKVYTT